MCSSDNAEKGGAVLINVRAMIPDTGSFYSSMRSLGRLIVNSHNGLRQSIYARTAKAPSARATAATIPPREADATDAPLTPPVVAAPAALAPVPEAADVLLALDDRVVVALLLSAAAMGTAMCS